MDAHVLFYYIFVFYLAGVLRFVIAEDNSVTLKTTDATRKCVANYQQCDIKLVDKQGLPGFEGIPGETGDRGDSGPQGVPGPPGPMGPEGIEGNKGDKSEVGDAGLQGVPGLEGPKGPKGTKGEKGYAGVNGMPGLPGPSGLKGETGDIGSLGKAGTDGESGPQGPPGDHGDVDVGATGDPGPSGMPGQPGVCDCSLGSVGLNDDEREEGSVDDPFSLPCKGYAELESGKYYLWMEAVEIYCNMSTNQTCKLGPEPAGDTYSTKGIDSSSVWLSEMKSIEIQSLYGLSMEQILWLQERSISAYQTLRLHYKNFKPEFGPDNDSITLLTCNDIVVKSYPSDETPFFYSVVWETECKNEDEWCYLDLVLVSEWSNKLPIIDVLIKVNPGQNSMFKLQNKELCFG